MFKCTLDGTKHSNLLFYSRSSKLNLIILFPKNEIVHVLFLVHIFRFVRKHFHSCISKCFDRHLNVPSLSRHHDKKNLLSSVIFSNMTSSNGFQCWLMLCLWMHGHRGNFSFVKIRHCKICFYVLWKMHRRNK